MFVFDDVGLSQHLGSLKRVAFLYQQNEKNTFQQFNVAFFLRVQVPDFFPVFADLFFPPFMSIHSMATQFHREPWEIHPLQWAVPERSLRVWNRTAWITFKSSWNIFSRRLPKLPLRWGNIFVEVNLFWLFFCWSGLALAMWCGVIWGGVLGRCVHFALSCFIYVLVFFWNRNEQILFAKRWTYRCDPSSLLLSVDGLLAVGWWVAYLNPKLWIRNMTKQDAKTL